MLTSLPHRRIRVVMAVGHFCRVVSAKFWGESIWPILVGRFGRESFRPWVVSAHVGGGGSTYVSLDPASTAYPIKNIRNIRHSQII